MLILTVSNDEGLEAMLVDKESNNLVDFVSELKLNKVMFKECDGFSFYKSGQEFLLSFLFDEFEEMEKIPSIEDLTFEKLDEIIKSHDFVDGDSRSKIQILIF